MGFFENIGRSVQATGRTTLQKSKDLADITRLNSQRAENDKRINQLYQEIGRLYCELHGADPEPQLAQQVRGIAEMKAQNEAWNEQIQGLKGMAKCPHCGQFIPRNSVFCTNCGQRALPEDKAVCPGCGAVVDKGTLFCTACGTRIPGEAPAQEAAHCANCGAVVDKGTLFCTACGTRIPGEAPAQEAAHCANCGAQLEPGTLFCTACGTRIPGEAPAQEAAHCANCGAQLEPGTLFCTACGTPVQQTEEANEPN